MVVTDIGTNNAIFNQRAASPAGTGAVSVAGRDDSVWHAGYAHHHSRAARHRARPGHVDRHVAVDDHAVSDRAGDRSGAVWTGVGQVGPAAGAAGGTVTV